MAFINNEKSKPRIIKEDSNIYFKELQNQINNGVSGKNEGIPIGHNILNKYATIRKSMYFLTGGFTGSGKSTFIHDAFILNPLDWYIENKNNTPYKLNIVFRSMERSRTYMLAKWLSRKIFLDHNQIIPVGKLLGWYSNKLTMNEHDLTLLYEDYFNNLMEIVTIIDGSENPVGK